MRDPARIDVILEKMGDKEFFRDFLYKHLVGKYTGDQLTIQDQIMTQDIEEIVAKGIPNDFIEYWKENYDLRFGQALITWELVPDEKTLFYCEDPEV